MWCGLHHISLHQFSRNLSVHLYRFPLLNLYFIWLFTFLHLPNLPPPFCVGVFSCVIYIFRTALSKTPRGVQCNYEIIKKPMFMKYTMLLKLCVWVTFERGSFSFGLPLISVWSFLTFFSLGLYSATVSSQYGVNSSKWHFSQLLMTVLRCSHANDFPTILYNSTLQEHVVELDMLLLPIPR